MPVCGKVEAYNEQSLCVKYCSQGVQTSFYESTPSASDSLGNAISRGGGGSQKIQGMREQISLMLPDTPGFYSNVFLVRKASGGWRPVIDLKQLNHHIDTPPLSHAHHKLSAEYRQKRRLHVQN